MSTYHIPNLLKASQVLSELARAPRGMTTPEIEAAAGLPKATAFRILKTFEHTDFVRKDDGRFYPGPALVEIGLLSLNQVEIRRMAAPFLQDLTDSLGFTSHLAIPRGRQSMIIKVHDSPNPVRVASRAGTLVDLHCSSTGKVFLAYNFADNLAEGLIRVPPIRRTEYTLTNPHDLLRETEEIRRKGYALDNREFHDDIRCMAAPVYDNNRRVIAALGVTAPVNQFPESMLENVSRQVLDATQALSRQMGAMEDM